MLLINLEKDPVFAQTIHLILALLNGMTALTHFQKIFSYFKQIISPHVPPSTRQAHISINSSQTTVFGTKIFIIDFNLSMLE